MQERAGQIRCSSLPAIERLHEHSFRGFAAMVMSTKKRDSRRLARTARSGENEVQLTKLRTDGSIRDRPCGGFGSRFRPITLNMMPRCRNTGTWDLSRARGNLNIDLNIQAGLADNQLESPAMDPA